MAREALLSPPVRHGLEQRDERGRAGEEHVVGERILGERRVGLERRRQQRVARHEAHDEVGRSRELLPVLLGRQLLDVGPQLARVGAELARARLFVGRLGRVEIRRERHLRVDDDLGSVREVHDQVRPLGYVLVGADRQLLIEVAVLGHARHLDDPAELQLTPSAARLGPAQRRDEVPRLGGELLLGPPQQVDLARDVAVGLLALLLDVVHVLLEADEQVRHGPDRRLHRAVALLAMTAGLLGELADHLFHHVLGLGGEGLMEPVELHVEAGLLALDRRLGALDLGGEPGALLTQLARRRSLGHELGPGALELLGDPVRDREVREVRGRTALQEHRRPRDADHDPADRCEQHAQHHAFSSRAGSRSMVGRRSPVNCGLASGCDSTPAPHPRPARRRRAQRARDLRRGLRGEGRPRLGARRRGDRGRDARTARR